MLNIHLSKTTKIVSSAVVILLIAVGVFLYYKKDKEAKNSNQNDDIAIIGQDYTEKASDEEINDTEQAEESQTPSATANTATTPKSQTAVNVSVYTIEITNLGLKAPIILNVDGNNKEAYNKALEKGVAHMAKTALPGENGNSVIFGHSSYYANKPGNYKEIFAKLDKLNVGDVITVKANDKTFTYKVTNEKVVPPSDISVVSQGKNKKTITLITCWPPKTTTNRYIIVAELQ